MSSSSIRTLYRRLTSAQSPLITTTFLRRSHQSSIPSSPLRLITTTTTTTTTPCRQFTSTTTIRRCTEKPDPGFHTSPPPPRSFHDLSLTDSVVLGISVPITVGWLICFYFIIKDAMEEHYANLKKHRAVEDLKLQIFELQRRLVSMMVEMEQQRLQNMESKKQVKNFTRFQH